MIVKIIISIVIGGALGYANYRWVGCATGACPLTSNPWLSVASGMALGGFIANAVR